MAEHDYNIANQGSAAARTDLNNLFAAIVSNNSKATAPTSTFAFMWWYDTTNDILYMRNAADDEWIIVGLFNQSGNFFDLLDDTLVKTSGGTTRGQLGSPASSVWETGTATREYLIAPDVLKSTIEALAPVKVTDETDISSAADYQTPVFGSSTRIVEIKFSNLIPAVDGESLEGHGSTNGGTSYATTAGDYQNGMNIVRVGSSDTNQKDDNASSVYLSGSVGSAGNEAGCSGSIIIHDPLGAHRTHMEVKTIYENTGSAKRVVMGGAWKQLNTGAMNRFRLKFTGNIESGKVTVLEY